MSKKDVPDLSLYRLTKKQNRKYSGKHEDCENEQRRLFPLS